jgi:hypothetical protein
MATIPRDIYYNLRDTDLWLSPIVAHLMDGSTELDTVLLSGNAISGDDYIAFPATFATPDAGDADALIVRTQDGDEIVRYDFLTPLTSTGAKIRVAFTDNIWLSYVRQVEFTIYVDDKYAPTVQTGLPVGLAENLGGLALCTFDKYAVGVLDGVDISSQYLDLYNTSVVSNLQTEKAFFEDNPQDALLIVPFTGFDEDELFGFVPPRIEGGVTTGPFYVSDIQPIIDVERLTSTTMRVKLLNPLTGYNVRLYWSRVVAGTYSTYALLISVPVTSFSPTGYVATLPSSVQGQNLKVKAVYSIDTTYGPQSQVAISTDYLLQ